MATSAGSTSQEYWRPSNPNMERVLPSLLGICLRCGMDYSPGARYCHFCGGPRDTQEPPSLVRTSESTTNDQQDLLRMFHHIGLSTPCLVCLVVAAVFGLAAVLTGVIYREDTLVDWQAVQMWRIEWLLGAAVALLTGILLKKRNP